MISASAAVGSVTLGDSLEVLPRGAEAVAAALAIGANHAADMLRDAASPLALAFHRSAFDAWLRRSLHHAHLRCVEVRLSAEPGVVYVVGPGWRGACASELAERNAWEILAAAAEARRLADLVRGPRRGR